MLYTLTIPGEPVGKARPRVTRNGVFTPKATRDYEQWVRTLFLARYKTSPLTGGIQATITAYFSLRKSDYAKSGPNKTGRLKLGGTMRPVVKPDADNIAKAILDALNGIAYNDDNQIVALTVEKYYAETPRVELTLTTL